MTRLVLILLLLAGAAAHGDEVATFAARRGATLHLDAGSFRSELQPLIHYRCEDNAASTTVTDASGNTNGTSTRNTSVFSSASGKISRGFDFYTGDSDDDIDLGSDVIGTGDYTFCAWAAPDGVGESFGRFFAATTANINYLAMNANGVIISANINSISDQWEAGVWKHYCESRSGGYKKNYLNGVLQRESEIGTGDSGNAEGINIIGNNVAATRAFDGDMDDIRIYNRQLTDAEVAWIYEQGTGHQNQATGTTTERVVVDATATVPAVQAGGVVFAQTTAANRPGQSSTNGRHTINFDGTNDYLSSTSTLDNIFDASAKTLAIVTDLTDDGNDHAILTSGTDFILSIDDSDGEIDATNDDGGADTLSAAITTAGRNVVIYSHDGTNQTLEVNRAVSATGASGATSALATGLTIGATDTTTISGNLCEVIAFDRVLPAQERDKLRQMLAHKWGVSQ